MMLIRRIKSFSTVDLFKSGRFWLSIIVFIVSFGLIYHQLEYQRKILHELTENRKSIEEIFKHIREDIPESLGASHIDLRNRFILNQIKQVEDSYIIFFGDSIIEEMNIYQINNKQVINAGVGGG